jgi:hypothetical protein
MGPAGPIEGVSIQLEAVSQQAESLPADTREQLLAAAETLNNDLDAARRGEAESGWSSVEVVNMVSDLCRSSDLIGWTVQPEAGGFSES